MDPFRKDARVDDLQAAIVNLNKKNTQLARFYKYAVLSLFITISGIAGFGLRLWSEQERPTREEVGEAIFAAYRYERHASEDKPMLQLGRTVYGTIHAPYSWVNADSWRFEAREGETIRFSVYGGIDARLMLEFSNSNGTFWAISTGSEDERRVFVHRFEKSGQYEIQVLDINDGKYHLPFTYELRTTRIVH